MELGGDPSKSQWVVYIVGGGGKHRWVVDTGGWWTLVGDEPRWVVNPGGS